MTARGDTFERYIDREVNRVLVAGALIAGILGAASGVALLGLIAAGVPGRSLPAMFAFGGGALGFGLHALARRELLPGRVVRYAVMALTFLPTAFFLAAHATEPGGAAGYITGPYSYLYLLLVVLTGFTLQPGLAVAAGFLAAAGYVVVFVLARGELATISAPRPEIVRDLKDPSVFVLRGSMMVATGFLVAALARYSKTLARRILAERERRDMIEKLFGQYVSDEVREKITSANVGAAGERRRVTVLFSDIRGFSRFSEEHPPEEVVARLNEYFDRMVAAISAEGGVVDKFIGDAVMGVFGGLVELERPGARAFAAALGMRRALAELNAAWQREGRTPFEAGVGLDHGEVVQGPLGAERRKDFTVIGDPVNTASRVEGLGKEAGFPVLLTQAVYDQLTPEQQAQCTPLGERAVRGKARAVAVYGVGAGEGAGAGADMPSAFHRNA